MNTVERICLKIQHKLDMTEEREGLDTEGIASDVQEGKGTRVINREVQEKQGLCRASQAHCDSGPR